MKIKTKRGARRIRNQRVVTRRFVVTDYTGCPYITAGKRYEVTAHSGTNLMDITCDHNWQLVILGPSSESKCRHLRNVGTWRYAVI